MEVLLIPKLLVFTDMGDPYSIKMVPGAVDDEASKQLSYILLSPPFVETISPA